jgi:triacylglycerol esterase/lipase EstA (alpha/beta hydrolase family)
MQGLRERGLPFVAINLEPVFGSIDCYAEVIESAMCRLERATGVPPVIVGHSMGGLAIRAWLSAQRQGNAADAAGRMHSVVTIGSPHHGTRLARLALVTNARQMRPGCAWLRALAATEDASIRSRFTCFHSHSDNIVIPAWSGALPEADNRHLPGVAHVQMVDQDAVWREVIARLGPDAEKA